MINSIWKRAWPWIRRLVALLVIIYFGQKIADGWAEKQDVLHRFDISLFTLSTFILSGAFSLLPIASKLTAELFQINLPIKASFRTYFYSQAGKYLPGGIWSYVGRVYLFNKEGINKRTAFSIIFLELIFLVVSGVFCFLVSIYYWDSIPNSILRYMIIGFLLISLFLLFPIFQKRFSPLLNRIGFQTVIEFQPIKIILIMLIYISFWEIVGIGFYYLIKAVAPVSLEMIIVLGGIYPLAWIMGKFIFFMPAGIGVREGALVYLLGFFLAPNQAIWTSLVSRIWWIVAELFCGSIVLVWGLLSRGKA